VGVFGVLTGQQGQAGDGVLVDPNQSGGLPNAAPLGEMLQDRQYLFMRRIRPVNHIGS
jgi:hypothetical protein